MSSLITVLNLVIRGEHKKFCSLCFSNDQSITTLEKLKLQINQQEEVILVTEILQSVFGNEIHEYLTSFESVCEDCLKTIISIYSFIQSSQYNIKLLMNTLDSLSNSFEYTKDINAKSKSLFVSLELTNYTSKHIYDNKKLDSAQTAMKRYRFLNKPKMTSVHLKKEESSYTSKKQCTSKVAILDMLLDPINKLELKCKVCFKVFPTMWNLKNHYIRNHAPKDYKCTKCSKAYGSHTHLMYHQSQNHCEIVCSECGKIFKNRLTLVRHEKAHHLKLVCSNCGRIYKNKTTYKNHIDLNICKRDSRASPTNAQFTCDYCNKKYTQKMSLRVHIQYEHGNYKAHICEFCGKKFWAQSRLKAHIVTHTREKNYTCSTCQGKFVSKQSLLYHSRLHTGEKPYKCSKCNFTFVSASRRAYHMKTYHHGAMIECDICHSKFASHSYLFKHRKTHKQPNGDIDGELKERSKKVDIRIK